MKAIIISLILFLSCTNGSFNDKPVISAVAGNLTVNGKAEKTGTVIKHGDVIETGTNSFCEITLNKRSIIKLSQNTVFVFNISESENNFELKSGSLTGLTRKKFTKQGDYNIKTPTGIAAIRGTAYFIHIESPDSTYFCVCNGTVSIKGETEETITSTHHKAMRITKKPGSKLSSGKNAPLLYHTDADIEKLADKIGEKINWNNAY